MTVASEPSPEVIQAWIDGETRRLDALRDRLAPLLEEERRIQDRLARLKDLLSAYASPDASEVMGVEAAVGAERGIHRGPQPEESIRDRVRRQATDILRAAGEPLHIGAITEVFRERGWPVPGRGQPANITVHLSGAPNIVPTGNGYYRLLQEGEQPPKPAARKRRTAARRSRKRG
jgi:hypothetical protein